MNEPVHVVIADCSFCEFFLPFGEHSRQAGSRTKIEKGSVVLLPAKFYYDIKNTGDSVLAMLGNRAEGFGRPTIYLDPGMNEKMKHRKQFERV